MTGGETGWMLDLNGNAINLAHVRRVMIGSRFQEAKSHEDEAPDGVTVFYVEAELVGAQCGEARPVLVQNLPDHIAAEHWVATRFWQPSFDVQRTNMAASAYAGPHASVEALVYDTNIPVAKRVEMLAGMPDVRVGFTHDGWQVTDERANASWELRAERAEGA
jgi:hypothetical protein